METNRIKKAIAILLVVLFLVTVTVGAASAGKLEKLRDHKEKTDLSSDSAKFAAKKPVIIAIGHNADYQTQEILNQRYYVKPGEKPQ